MRLKKYIIILFVVFLSGCTAKYNLNIDSNLILSEELTLTESNRILDTYTVDIDEYLDENIESFLSQDKYNYFFTEKVIGDNNSSIILSSTYLDFLEFKEKNKIKDMFFTDFIYSEISNIVTLNLIAKETIDLFIEDGLNSAAIDSANITITLPFDVTENNADEVDKKNNSYTWNYSKSKVNKDILLTFDKKAKAVKPVEKGVYVIIGFVAFILAVGLYVYYSYKKNNVL